MATRSHTDFYVSMRNKAAQHRHMMAEQLVSDRVALVAREEEVVEDVTLPPRWTEDLEEMQYCIPRLRRHIEELNNMQRMQIERPSLEDNTTTEETIQRMVHEINEMLSHAQSLLQQIKRKSYSTNVHSQRLGRNVVSAFASSLQDITISFRKAQSSYLEKLKLREEWSQQFFEIPQSDSYNKMSDHSAVFELEDFASKASPGRQVKHMKQDNAFLIEREKEVSRVATSIEELNHVFRDLAQLVSDQGMTVDQIEYNIENSQVKIEEGKKQLEKAVASKTSHRKKCLLLALIVGFILILILILAFNS